MPEVTIEIGGRQFEVACQDGEEHYLRSAEKLLDAEASVLQKQIGRMPEPRMLLMSALMLADKTAALQEKLTDAEKLLADTRVELEQMKNAPAAIAFFLFVLLLVFKKVPQIVLGQIDNKINELKNKINDNKNDGCNKHTLDYSVKICIEMYKSAISNKINGNINNFDIKNLKYNRDFFQ